MSLKDDLESCAYHEAGHAVAAYEFGWYLRHGGVRIGKNAEARLRTPDELRTSEAEIIVTLGGMGRGGEVLWSEEPSRLQ